MAAARVHRVHDADPRLAKHDALVDEEDFGTVYKEQLALDAREVRRRRSRRRNHLKL